MSEHTNQDHHNNASAGNAPSLSPNGTSEQTGKAEQASAEHIPQPTPIEAEPFIPPQAFNKPAAPAKPAPTRPVFIAPQTIDRVAFEELSRTLGEMIASAERANHTLRQSTEHAASQRDATKEDIAQQKSHIGLIARLLRAVDQRTKQLDTAIDRHFADAGDKVADKLIELEASLGTRAKDIDNAIEQAVERVHQTVGTRQDELQVMADQLKSDIDNARARHAAEAQKQVDKAATTLVASIMARAADLKASIEATGTAAKAAIESAETKSLDTITLHADQCDSALHSTAQGLQTALNEHATSGEAAINDRAKQCATQLKQTLDKALAATDEKLVSVDRFAEQAVAKVESRITNKAEQAEARASAAAAQIKDATNTALSEIRSEADELTDAATSKLEAMGTTAHRELAAAFDDRVNRLETIITARRAQLVDQLDKADARLRLMEKVEHRIEDKATRLLDGLEQRVRERTDAILGEAEQRITTKLSAINQCLDEAEQRHRAVVATLADDADQRIDAYEALFVQARATLGTDPNDPEAPAAPGSLADLIDRAGELLEHLHAATARLALTRDHARRTNTHNAAQPTNATQSPDAILDAIRDATTPINKTTPAPSPTPTNPDPLESTIEDRDPVLDAIERLRGSVTTDLERLTKALHSARREPGASSTPAIPAPITTPKSHHNHAA